MFDNNPQNTNQPMAPQPPNAPQAGPATSSQDPSNSEPKDIFAASDPLPHSSANDRQTVNNNPQSRPLPSPYANHDGNIFANSPISDLPVQLEPTIKATPSVFTPASSPTAFPVDGESAPGMALHPAHKKNIIFLVVILLLISVSAAAVIWWFLVKNNKTNENENISDMYQSPTNNINSNPDSENTQENNDSINGEIKETLADLPEDTDGDGLSDEDEAIYGTSSLSPDTDGDGLFDREEAEVYKTDPLRRDTDNDGLSDKEEVLGSTDPLASDNNPQLYKNESAKIEFTMPYNMALESANDNTLQFNDNIGQIKLYVFVNNGQIESVPPDLNYTLATLSDGRIVVTNADERTDETPVATVISSNVFSGGNGNQYMLRYVATKRSPDHRANFESILASLKILR